MPNGTEVGADKKNTYFVLWNIYWKYILKPQAIMKSYIISRSMTMFMVENCSDIMTL